MNINRLGILKTLNKVFRKEPATRADFENFTSELQILLSKVDEQESEEHLKYPLRDFLMRTSFAENEINTKGRTDLAIYADKTNKTPVQVIFEIKKPLSTAFPTQENANCKALHEAVLYYLRERVEEKNDEIKQVILTNVFEWYIFDAHNFEKYFYTKTLIKAYQDWKAGQKTSKSTEHFYQIVADYIANSSEEIAVTYFDLRAYQKLLSENEKAVVPLFKTLSATHLLKQSFATDSNTLNTQFYYELLYILGLEEVKEGNKKVIKRVAEGERQAGAFIENAISTLRTEGRLSELKDRYRFGKDEEEQLFHIALELTITWVNRILFLKLLEAQLIAFNKDKSYRFLDSEVIASYGELNELFFDVLAKELDERETFVKKELQNIPYLNSSLFEISNLEYDTIRIYSLRDRLALPTYAQTVLKNQKGERHKTKIPTLQYLFEFLNAYNFANEGADEIQDENKTLINAAVLGLIFEKINGYKEGSFFTPGYITMYMSHDTIRRAVVQKFRKAGYALSENLPLVEAFAELKTKIEDRKEANRIINSLKIIDPAVGSGHFLVSALNEMIAIKSELEILCYTSGRRILDFKVEVVNDDLVVTNLETDEVFEYTLSAKGNIIPYKQDLQEAIFYEKQYIIENCLFGVDINPNSVSICRLRLWIELLKHTFYTKSSNYATLETLPNIDINIKQGNSLISNFGMNGNGFANGSIQKVKLATQKYKEQVVLYKASDDKKVKRKAEQNIEEIKNMFANTVRPLDADYRLLKEKEGKLGEIPLLFTQEDKAKWQQECAELQKEIDALRAIIENKKKTIYRDAFEWRFEFPEVLNENGNFEGFDVVMGNPPYISIKDMAQNQKSYLIDNYETARGQFDLYNLFMEKAYELLKDDGYLSMITSNTYFANKNLQPIRAFLLSHTQIVKLVNLDERVFKEAKLDVGITLYKKTKDTENSQIQVVPNRIFFETGESYYLPQSNFKTSENNTFTIHILPADFQLFEKMQKEAVLLGDIANINRGIEYGSNSEEIKSRKYKNTYPIIVGHSIAKYRIKNIEGYAKFDKHNKSTYKDFALYSSPRILVQRIRNLSMKTRVVATYTEDTLLCTNTLRVITLKNSDFEYKFVLGILNSRLVNYFFLKNFLNKDIYAYQLGQIPIPKTSKKQQKQIAEIVSAIESKGADTDTSKLEQKIDRIVYKLYGLTKTEIAEIESFYE
ncbi:MAG: Eco57I restriction-modification methylase domain-containing protein [Bernardetiaceae bacterium]|nr:Eco57I restriction-modification methylase domain-containing protein [Bernardetiaceae bacterium]